MVRPARQPAHRSAGRRAIAAAGAAHRQRLVARRTGRTHPPRRVDAEPDRDRSPHDRSRRTPVAVRRAAHRSRRAPGRVGARRRRDPARAERGARPDHVAAHPLGFERQRRRREVAAGTGRSGTGPAGASGPRLVLRAERCGPSRPGRSHDHRRRRRGRRVLDDDPALDRGPRANDRAHHDLRSHGSRRARVATRPLIAADSPRPAVPSGRQGR